jgi:hypothetical protein
MEKIIYGLCTLTSLICAILLFRSYFAGRHRLLFWSGLCFAVLSINNILVVMDNVIFLNVDLLTLRLAAGLIALLLLLYGLIWEKP